MKKILSFCEEKKPHHHMLYYWRNSMKISCLFAHSNKWPHLALCEKKPINDQFLWVLHRRNILFHHKIQCDCEKLNLKKLGFLWRKKIRKKHKIFIEKKNSKKKIIKFYEENQRIRLNHTYQNKFFSIKIQAIGLEFGSIAFKNRA